MFVCMHVHRGEGESPEVILSFLTLHCLSWTGFNVQRGLTYIHIGLHSAHALCVQLYARNVCGRVSL